ncbi:MAG TPA: tetratricopeptide repeat protein [Bryobacteraceae bacterium]|nr:tetratricopeptide repeat protein [Bryobacteraceae bacterium]
MLAIAATAALKAQSDDPAFAPLAAAYQALRAKDYDAAIDGFRLAATLAPDRPAIREDLAYTLLKTGDTEAARDQFAEALRWEPANDQIALEYAFLCYETRKPVVARRIFERLSKAGNSTAAEAFENIDRPLREGIARWSDAAALDPGNFSAHEELARLAEQRDDLALASEHFETAWRLRPDRRDLLLDLGRVWKGMGRQEDSVAALIAAWRGASARVSEQARELLPDRYPYLSEFEHALALDPANTQLQKDVDYFRNVSSGKPAEAAAAPALRTRQESAPLAPNAKELGIKSLDKGYLGDALKYLHIAHEDDPQDYEVMLKLGWAYNIVKDDQDALRWFDQARQSPDPAVSAEASQAYRNLLPGLKRFSTTLWTYPIYSTRWRDAFGYAQIKTETRLAFLPLRPYVSLRLVGDLRGSVQTAFGPQFLSDRSAIAAAGLATVPFHNLTGWFEAGESIFFRQTPQDRSRMKPDYRGGVSYGAGFGHLLASGSHGVFEESNIDGVFVSRFASDSLLYSQNRFGYTLRGAEGFGGFHLQALWNANLTADAQRQYWANFVESGPGFRFRFDSLPASPMVSVSLLRGAYLINDGNPRRPNYNELRVAIWYAITR